MSLNVLIVDDTKFTRQLLSNIVQQLGDYTTAEAETAQDALVYYKMFFPDLVFLDTTIPKTNSVEWITQLLIIDPNAQIIVCSTNTQNSEISQAMREGAVGYLMKPFTLEDVKEVLSKTKKGKKQIGVETLENKGDPGSPEQQMMDENVNEKTDVLIDEIHEGVTNSFIDHAEIEEVHSLPVTPGFPIGNIPRKLFETLANKGEHATQLLLTAKPSQRINDEEIPQMKEREVVDGMIATESQVKVSGMNEEEIVETLKVEKKNHESSNEIRNGNENGAEEMSADQKKLNEMMQQMKVLMKQFNDQDTATLTMVGIEESPEENESSQRMTSTHTGNWSEEIDGEAKHFLVTCTEGDDRLNIEVMGGISKKQTITFTMSGFFELASWIEAQIKQKI